MTRKPTCRPNRIMNLAVVCSGNVASGTDFGGFQLLVLVTAAGVNVMAGQAIDRRIRSHGNVIGVAENMLVDGCESGHCWLRKIDLKISKQIVAGNKGIGKGQTAARRCSAAQMALPTERDDVTRRFVLRRQQRVAGFLGMFRRDITVTGEAIERDGRERSRRCIDSGGMTTGASIGEGRCLPVVGWRDRDRVWIGVVDLVGPHGGRVDVEPAVLVGTLEKTGDAARPHQQLDLGGDVTLMLLERSQCLIVGLRKSDRKLMTIVGPSRSDIAMTKQAFITGHVGWKRLANMIIAPGRCGVFVRFHCRRYQHRDPDQYHQSIRRNATLTWTAQTWIEFVAMRRLVVATVARRWMLRASHALASVATSDGRSPFTHRRAPSRRQHCLAGPPFPGMPSSTESARRLAVLSVSA
jgi:hypothetical protein